MRLTKTPTTIALSVSGSLQNSYMVQDPSKSSLMQTNPPNSFRVDSQHPHKPGPPNCTDQSCPAFKGAHQLPKYADGHSLHCRGKVGVIRAVAKPSISTQADVLLQRMHTTKHTTTRTIWMLLVREVGSLVVGGWWTVLSICIPLI